MKKNKNKINQKVKAGLDYFVSIDDNKVKRDYSNIFKNFELIRKRWH